MINIAMFLFGLFALIMGKLNLSRKSPLEGWRARVTGLFLMAPLPGAFMAGIIIGLVQGPGSKEKIQAAGSLIELGLMALGLVGAFVFVAVTKPKNPGSAQGG